MPDETRQHVLVVLADGAATRLVLEALAARGIHGSVARGKAEAAARIADRRWDLVLADLDTAESRAAGGRAFGLLREARDHCPELPVVVTGPSGCVATAVGAMREGARDFLPQPLTRKAVESVLDAFVPSHVVPTAAPADARTGNPYYLAGRSPRLLETVAVARKVAPTTVPVLITGESGTGKELIAHLIHHHSRRAGGPFVAVNCGALSETLLESELFGHERGAFTGAHARRKGRFELAHGGTLLMDEISETGPRLQAELLRVLEQQDFERLGGSERVRVNVRVVSTSNRDLAAEVTGGTFRRDLYYRLRGVRVTVPPLRERREDIPVLVWHFVNLHAGEVGRCVERLDAEMMDLFQAYAWPGNVRQLRNIVRTALILGEGPALSLAEAPCVMAELRGGDRGDDATLALAELERRAIVEALRRTRQHQARAAELLGITDRTLREKLRRYRRDGRLPEDLLPEGRYESETEREPRWATIRT